MLPRLRLLLGPLRLLPPLVLRLRLLSRRLGSLLLLLLRNLLRLVLLRWRLLSPLLLLLLLLRNLLRRV